MTIVKNSVSHLGFYSSANFTWSFLLILAKNCCSVKLIRLTAQLSRLFQIVTCQSPFGVYYRPIRDQLSIITDRSPLQMGLTDGHRLP
jgi:hypothetical protein